MNARNALHVLAILFATAAISADNSSISGSVNGVELSKEKPQEETAKMPTRTACLTHCEASEGRCSREVRTARRECERAAANGGRDVFTGRNTNGGAINITTRAPSFTPGSAAWSQSAATPAAVPI